MQMTRRLTRRDDDDEADVLCNAEPFMFVVLKIKPPWLNPCTIDNLLFTAFLDAVGMVREHRDAYIPTPAEVWLDKDGHILEVSTSYNGNRLRNTVLRTAMKMIAQQMRKSTRFGELNFVISDGFDKVASGRLY